MGILSKILKAQKSSQDNFLDTLTVEQKKYLQHNFVIVEGVIRNRDDSKPSLSDFMKDDLFSIDDYTQLVHGLSQKKLQDKVLSGSKIKRLNKKEILNNRIKEKAKASKSVRVDALKSDFYAFGLFTPFGIYTAARTFGLPTLERFLQKSRGGNSGNDVWDGVSFLGDKPVVNYAAGETMGKLMLANGNLDTTSMSISPNSDDY